MDRTKFDHLRNRLLLVGVVFILTYFLSALIDKEYAVWLLSGKATIKDYVIDMLFTIASSFVLVEWSVFYSNWSFRRVSFTRNPYKGLLVNSFLLLIFNNLTAWCFSLICIRLFDDESSFLSQGLYISSVIVTFVSYLYTNAHYLESYVHVENQKKELEIKLLKEKEYATQMQLEVLKSQIDPHFMFNNFSILSELIMEDRTLADKFLEHLSKVYRYVIQNLKRDIVSIQEEITFLYSYMYLIDIRYENAVRINVDNKLLKDNDGCIPPICLQLLVENAIKHNQFSASHPLVIRIYREEDWMVVENELRPVVSELVSTGIGHWNITGRYFLLCQKKTLIVKSKELYQVKLPVIHKEPCTY